MGPAWGGSCCTTRCSPRVASCRSFGKTSRSGHCFLLVAFCALRSLRTLSGRATIRTQSWVSVAHETTLQRRAGASGREVHGPLTIACQEHRRLIARYPSACRWKPLPVQLDRVFGQTGAASLTPCCSAFTAEYVVFRQPPIFDDARIVSEAGPRETNIEAKGLREGMVSSGRR